MDELFTNENLDYFDNTSDIWDSKIVKKMLRKTWSEWLSMRNWRVFLTLTFREETYPETALRKLKYLIRILNEETFGLRYINYVGHSYFSYIASIEYQKRDVIHFHVLIDRPVNFQTIHKYWNAWAGFAKPELVKLNENAVYYLTKYITKNGEMGLPYFAKKLYTPTFLPNWWIEQENKGIEEINQIEILS